MSKITGVALDGAELNPINNIQKIIKTRNGFRQDMDTPFDVTGQADTVYQSITLRRTRRHDNSPLRFIRAVFDTGQTGCRKSKRVGGELIIRPRPASGKGRGNAAATRKN